MKRNNKTKVEVCWGARYLSKITVHVKFLWEVHVTAVNI
jgi:hypothetical protein